MFNYFYLFSMLLFLINFCSISAVAFLFKNFIWSLFFFTCCNYHLAFFPLPSEQLFFYAFLIFKVFSRFSQNLGKNCLFFSRGLSAPTVGFPRANVCLSCCWWLWWSAWSGWIWRWMMIMMNMTMNDDHDKYDDEWRRCEMILTTIISSASSS